MRRVCIESPFAGKGKTRADRMLDEARNWTYTRACMRDCILRGETPYASHALYTQVGVLRDDVPDERALGIAAGFEWAAVAHARVFYLDRGFSSGMVEGLRHAVKIGQRVEIRGLAAWRGPLRIEALRRLNGELPADFFLASVDWAGL